MLQKFLLVTFLAGLLIASGSGNLALADPAQISSAETLQEELSSQVFLPSVYYIYSKNPFLRLFLRVSQDFDSAFSTELNSIQLSILKLIGIKTEPVRVYRVSFRDAPPFNPEQNPEICRPNKQASWAIDLLRGGWGGRAKVALLDTGINQEHPDLTDNIQDCLSLITHLWPESLSCEDKNGHGTQAAGLIAANGRIKGMAPESKISIIKVCDQRGFCFGDDIAAAIKKAAELPAQIIYLGFEGEESDPFVKKAIEKHPEILFVAGSGDQGPDLGSITYPAAWPEVVAVGALDKKLNVPEWSSQGSNDGDYIIEKGEIELSAPGVGLESTWIDGCYKKGQGTSLAAALVAGIASKFWQGETLPTRALLRHIAQDIGKPGDDPATGFGLPLLSTSPLKK